MPEHKNKILIFLKAPVKGFVKTRLAEHMDNDAVLELYISFVRDVVGKASGLADITLFYYPAEKKGVVESLLGRGYEMKPQAGRTLGAKMANAFKDAFKNGADSAVLIGTDIPDIPVSFLDEALEILGTHDAVLCPVNDGGYCLIGFTAGAFRSSVFEGIEWSTESVFDDTVEHMAAQGLEYHLLPVWHDIDTAEDLENLWLRLKNRESHANETFKTLLRYEKTNIRDHTGSERNRKDQRDT